MSLETLALSLGKSVGKQLLQSATQKDGTIRHFAETTGQRLLQKLGRRFENQLDQALASTPNGNGAGPHVTLPSSHTGPQGVLHAGPGGKLAALTMGRMDSETALAGLKSLDTNNDGTLSREELDSGLTSLNQQIVSLKQQGGALGIEGEATLQNSEQLYALAKMAQTHYSMVASLDGVEGTLSLDDMTALASRDDHAGDISGQDWFKLFSAGL